MADHEWSDEEVHSVDSDEQGVHFIVHTSAEGYGYLSLSDEDILQLVKIRKLRKKVIKDTPQ